MAFEDEQLPREFGKYHLIERIATGGMAQLYRAKLYGAGGFEKDLAVKKILPHLGQDEDFVQMFMDEAMITVTLNHGNIAQVLDFGEVEGEYFLVMEYVDGIDLQSLLKRAVEEYNPIDTNLSAFIIQEVCQGLDYAHHKLGLDGQPQQIVHRDISPQNVLISFEGQVKLVDFGIARATSRITSTQAGVVKGKVAYMSPEQLLGRTVDGRSDIFAAGIILYELLTHKKPFEGATPQETMALITRGEYQSPQKLNRHVTRRLAQILKKALEKSPRKRYATAGKMAASLASYLHSSGQPPNQRLLAELVRQRLPEAKPRIIGQTPIRFHKRKISPSKPASTQREPASQLLGSQQTAENPVSDESKQSTRDSNPSSADARQEKTEPAKRKSTEPSFPMIPSKPEQNDANQVVVDVSEQPVVVQDSEAVSYEMLGLEAQGPDDARSTANTDNALVGDNQQTEDVSSTPSAQPTSASSEELAVHNQDSRDNQDQKEPDQVQPEQASHEADDSQKQSGPADNSNELAQENAFETPTQIRPEVGPTEDTHTRKAIRSEVSDQFQAWVDAGAMAEESAEIDPEFEDQAPAFAPKNNNYFFIALGLALLMVGAIWILSSDAEDSRSAPATENTSKVTRPNTVTANVTEKKQKENNVSPTPRVSPLPGPDKSIPMQPQPPSGPTATDTEAQTAAKPDQNAAQPPQQQNKSIPDLASVTKPREQAKQQTKPQKRPKPILARKKTRPQQVPKPKRKTHQSATIPKGSGTLRINSEPFSVVYWKKKRLGPTPQMAIRLPVGSHTLTLRNDALGIEKRVRVRIEKNKVHTVFVELSK